MAAVEQLAAEDPAPTAASTLQPAEAPQGGDAATMTPEMAEM